MSRVLVLCYHGVSASWPSDLAVAPERLERQLSLLTGRGYRGATFMDAVTAPAAERTLAVTFDDAYRSVLELALPVLASLGLPGSVYVPTAFPGSERPMSWPGIEEWVGTPHESELACMSWDELGSLAERGWEVGSHTVSHPRLTELGDAELEEELAGSRAQAERALGRPCESIAYPYGDVDDRVARAAAAAGYRAGGTLPGAFEPPSPIRWPRVGVYRGDASWRYRLKVSRPLRAVRSSPAWRAVDRLRRD